METRLLIVDDSPISRQLIRRLLPQGTLWEVREASSGQEAIDLCAEWQPQVMLADHIMPGMDGVELITRAVEAVPGLRCLALTSDIQKTTRQRLLEAGAAEVLHKPIDREGLARALAVGGEPSAEQ